MKKIKIIVYALSVFFLYNCNNVYAKELTCLYEGNSVEPAIMLVQTNNKERLIYVNSVKEKPLIDDSNWKKYDKVFEINWDTGFYDEKNKMLTDCPSYVSYKFSSCATYEGIEMCEPDPSKTIFTFSKGVIKGYYNQEKYKKYDELPSLDNFKQEFNDDYSEEIKNTMWIGTCNYEDVILYFNRTRMILENKETSTDIENVKAGFSLNELLDYYALANICPIHLYKSTVDANEGNGVSPALYITYFLTGGGNRVERSFIKEGSSITPDDNIVDDILEPIESCLALFNPNFIDKINYCLLFVRVFIPILLIVLGTLDFAKAIFSGSEDEMKKAQGKFIKRILAAILVFLIPTLVNFLLEIANSIWSYIDPNSCNIG